MGAWSTGLFGGDVACDVRDGYVDYLKMGMTEKAATKRILEDFSDELDDVQDGPVVWMALAVTQWKYGRLEPRVKSMALRVIKAGGDLESRETRDRARRRRVLEQVRVRLESPPPPEKAVRVVKPAEPPKKIEQIWNAGQIVAFRRDSGRFVLFLTEGVVRHEYAGQVPYFILLKWEGAKIPEAVRVQTMRSSGRVVGVQANRKGDPIPWDRVQRLDVRRDPTGTVDVEGDEVFCEEGFDEVEWNEVESWLDE